MSCLLQAMVSWQLGCGCHLVIGVGQNDVFELPGRQRPIGVTRLEEPDQAVVEAVVVAEDERDRVPPAQERLS